MRTAVQNIAFDCADAYTLARFWSAVMDAPLNDAAAEDDEEVVVLTDSGADLYFQRVPEAKSVKNRVHICLRPELACDDEVRRVTALGAVISEDHRRPDGSGWVVLLDPEGNEFCVLRGDPERS